jgi:putative transcriptional regulator
MAGNPVEALKMSPRITSDMTVDAQLVELGERLKALRISARITQARLAQTAGMARATLQRLEGGQGGDLRNFLAVLAALGKSEALEVLLPEVPLSPVELLKRAGSLPKRVGSPRKAKARAKRPFKWGDEQ